MRLPGRWYCTPEESRGGLPPEAIPLMGPLVVVEMQEGLQGLRKRGAAGEVTATELVHSTPYYVSPTPAGPQKSPKTFPAPKPTASNTIAPAVIFSCVHIPAFALHAAFAHIRDISAHPHSPNLEHYQEDDEERLGAEARHARATSCSPPRRSVATVATQGAARLPRGSRRHMFGSYLSSDESRDELGGEEGAARTRTRRVSPSRSGTDRCLLGAG